MTSFLRVGCCEYHGASKHNSRDQPGENQGPEPEHLPNTRDLHRSRPSTCLHDTVCGCWHRNRDTAGNTTSTTNADAVLGRAVLSLFLPLERGSQGIESGPQPTTQTRGYQRRPPASAEGSAQALGDIGESAMEPRQVPKQFPRAVSL